MFVVDWRDEDDAELEMYDFERESYFALTGPREEVEDE